MPNDQRLIEDYIPIEAISAEARREKSIRKGHISTLHLWWARRPLVAARAAVYGALVPAPHGKKAAEEAEAFVKALCTYPGPTGKIEQARRAILEAHAARLSAEHGSLVTVEDIEAGRAPRPRVLDMFAGGGSIPLEALRLGCEAHALDLNPVAHIIELCTLVYPQQFGKPDASAKGCAPDGTWAGLAKEVEHWGKWVLEKVREEIGDLYPPIPDPDYKPEPGQPRLLDVPVIGEGKTLPKGWLTPVAYLWTRTVRCSNPGCGGVVPLARRTWLAKKVNRYVALLPDAEVNRAKTGNEKRVVFKVIESKQEVGLGFNPDLGSIKGSVACPFCGTVATSIYIKSEGKAGRIGTQLMAVIGTRPGNQSKKYFSIEQLSSIVFPNQDSILSRVIKLAEKTNNSLTGQLSIPDETIEANPRSMDVQNYGFVHWSDLFTKRQQLCLLTFIYWTHQAFSTTNSLGYKHEQVKALITFLAVMVDRLADFSSSLCTWNYTGGRGTKNTFPQQSLPIVWDFAESNPFNEIGANWQACIKASVSTIQSLEFSGKALVNRGSATELQIESNSIDVIITDPPYYDNVSYSNLSDFFYIWLKRSLGFLYNEHFSTLLTPKKKESIAASYRHSGNKNLARKFYEDMMAKAFAEGNRVLKQGAPLVIVYAHKTTLGWATLVDSLRTAKFTVSEAWPLDTERPGRTISMDTAALSSSIFIVARRREGDETGAYEKDVQPELRMIVQERLERL